MGFEPTTFGLEGQRSTAELFPQGTDNYYQAIKQGNIYLYFRGVCYTCSLYVSIHERQCHLPGPATVVQPKSAIKEVRRTFIPFVIESLCNLLAISKHERFYGGREGI